MALNSRADPPSAPPPGPRSARRAAPADLPLPPVHRPGGPIDPPGRPPGPLPVRRGRSRRRAALAVICAAALIINVDNTILNVALPTLVRTLHATSSELQWIVDSYAMVFAGLLLVGGSLADRIGRRRFFLDRPGRLRRGVGRRRVLLARWTC